MAENTVPIPLDRVLPDLRLNEAETVLLLASLTMTEGLLAGIQADAVRAIREKVEAQRASSHRILRKVIAKERLHAIVREQMPRMVNGARIVTRPEHRRSRYRKQVLHATILDAGHPEELNVRLDDGTYDQWAWSDPMLRLEGEAEYDETA